MKVFLLQMLILAFASYPGLLAAGTFYHRFRQEQGLLASAARQDMLKNLQRIKAAADAQGPTSTASTTIAAGGQGAAGFNTPALW